MNFLNFTLILFPILVIGKKIQTKKIESILNEKHIEIKGIFALIERKTPKTGVRPKKLEEFNNRISNLIEKEENEHKMAIKLLQLYKHKGIYELLKGKIAELEKVKSEYHRFSNTYSGHTLINDFINILENYELQNDFYPFLNKYRETLSTLTRPGFENEKQILADIRSIVTKQIDRIKYLNDTISKNSIKKTSSCCIA